MRQVVYSVAMSLDGHIAGPQGESDWIVIDPEIDFEAIFARFDVILMGRKTYEVTRTQGGSMAGVTSYVFSRTLRQADCPGVKVSDDPWQTVPPLKEQAGKDIWLFGGGELFRSLLELGLVDRVSVAVVPVLLGGGLPLLPDLASRAQLRLEEERVYPKTGTVLAGVLRGTESGPARADRLTSCTVQVIPGITRSLTDTPGFDGQPAWQPTSR